MKEIYLKSGIMQLQVKSEDLPLEDLCGFACRQNPKRGFLFVSKVLGKHYPVRPQLMQKIYDMLGRKVYDITQNQAGNTLFLGFAETATGLGAGIYESWKNLSIEPAFYLHTSRYDMQKEKLLNFQEEHSHATGHIVFSPEKQFHTIMNNLNTLVMVDDEMTTGNTAKNFINEFVQHYPHVKNIILVSIKNWMDDDKIANFSQQIPGINFTFVSLVQGSYQFIKDADYVCEPMPNVDGNYALKDDILNKNHGRTGIESFNQYDFEKLTENVEFNKKTLVLGTGEFHYPAFLLAKFLEQKGMDVVYQSTTRSPILIGHDIEHKINFNDNYGDNIPNFIYNVAPEQYEQVLICYETKEKNGCSLDTILHAQNIFF